MDRPQPTDRPAPHTRPRNRRALILRAAARLFVERGYENLAMSEVADAVNVRPSALYAHFRGKQDLLAATITAEFAPARALIVERRSEGLDSVLDGLVNFSLDHRGLWALWQRESRNLEESQRDELRKEIQDAVTTISVLLRRRRQKLTPQRAELLALALMSVLLSSGQHRLELPRPVHEGLMVEVGNSVLHVDLLDPKMPPDAPPIREALTLHSTREALLEAATTQFAARGYGATSVDDIGNAVGIAGPSVYRHYSSKAELLAAAIARAMNGLRIELSRVLAISPDARTALVDLLGAYVSFAFAHSPLIDVLAIETANLPADRQRETSQAIREYIAEWTYLLQDATRVPELPARIRVVAALSMVNDIARTPHLRAAVGSADLLRAAGSGILLGESTPTRL